MVRDDSTSRDQGLLQLPERSQPQQNGDVEQSREDGNAHDKPTELPSPLANTESIITQVTTRDAANQQSKHSPKEPVKWKRRLQSFFCCLSPQTKGPYYRPEPEVIDFKPFQPPTAPQHEGPAVLGDIHPEDLGKKTLVLDLDETLVHSSFKPVMDPDYIIPVEIDGRIVDVYVLKRPLADEFLEAIAGRFEIVIFTASLSKYADPLLDLLDPNGVIRWRLFRESCYPYQGNYVKNLLCLGRDLSQVIIVDNSPHSYVFQPANALPIGSFIDDPDDRELTQCLQVLKGVEHVQDVRSSLSKLVTKMQADMAKQYA